MSFSKRENLPLQTLGLHAHIFQVSYSYLTRLEILVVSKLCVVQSFIFGGPSQAPESSNPYNKTDISSDSQDSINRVGIASLGKGSEFRLFR